MKISDPILFKKIKDRCRVTEDDCWQWTQCKQSNGYGRIRFNGVTQYAHRAMYAAFRGPESIRGKDIGQTCCNPAHLVAGERIDTMNRCVERETQAKGLVLSMKKRGQRSYLAKLTTESVIQIRARMADDVPLELLAQEYGVTVSNLKKIRDFKTWRIGFLSSMPVGKISSLK